MPSMYDRLELAAMLKWRPRRKSEVERGPSVNLRGATGLAARGPKTHEALTLGRRAGRSLHSVVGEYT